MEPLITDNNSAPLVVDDGKENRGQGDQLDIGSKKGYRVGRSRIRKIRSKSPTESVASLGSGHKLRSRIPYNRLHSVPRKYIPSSLLDSQIRADVKDAFNEDVIVTTPNGKSISDTAPPSNGETPSSSVTAPSPNGKTISESDTASPLNRKTISESVTAPPSNGKTLAGGVTAPPPNGETISDTAPPPNGETISDTAPPISESDSFPLLNEETPSGGVTAPPPNGKTISESDTALPSNEKTISKSETAPPPNGKTISESKSKVRKEKTPSQRNKRKYRVLSPDNVYFIEKKSRKSNDKGSIFYSMLEFADRFLTRMSSSIFATLGIFLMFFVIWMYDFTEAFLTTQEAVGDLFTDRSHTKIQNLQFFFVAKRGNIIRRSKL
ncbi:cell wall protein SED1-like [Drosophila teissieri]|uniref:cell wall protein SED1-like n=1 Tax=Drosophila teissieri TaxID=7243 RepID=UPI001CBA51BF|nr:cell wall protein SED1-like [Drosophila teissieri]